MPFRLRFPLLLLLLGLWGVPRSQAAGVPPGKVGQRPVPGWVQPVPLSLQTQVQPAEVSYGYHQLLEDVQYDVASQTVYQHRGLLVFTDDGLQNVSEVRVDFDPNFQHVLFHQVTVWRNGKALPKLNLRDVKVVQREKNLERHIYDESLTAVLFLEDVRVGDVIEYAYSVVGRNPAFKGTFFTYFYLQHYDPTDRISVAVRVPHHRKLHHKALHTQQQPTITSAGDALTYRWDQETVPGQARDEETPEWYDPFPRVYVSEFGSWQEVVQWALPLYERPDQPDAALLARIEQIRQDHHTDEDRLTATLRLVQDEVRYLGLEAGVGGFRPSAPSTVFARRFGDCKDKSLLLVTMLRQLGIEAYPALVHASLQEQVGEWLPMPFAFDHCIVQVVHRGRTLWYDPTISLQRGTYDQVGLPEYKRALVIRPGAKGLVPVSSASVSSTKVLETFLFQDVGGPVELKVKTEYRGLAADYQRSKFASTSLKEMEKGYLNYYAAHYPQIETKETLTFYDSERLNLFTTLEEYEVTDLWVPRDDDAGVLTAEFYPQMLRDRINVPGTSRRTMPLAVSSAHIEHTTELYLPEAWPVEDSRTTVSDEAFQYAQQISYTAKHKQITLHLTYQTRTDHVLAPGVAGYIKNQNKMLKDFGYTLTYNRALAGGAVEAGKKRFNGLMALLALIVLGVAGAGAYRLYHYDPPANGRTDREPEQLGGWLVLAAVGLVLSPILMLSNLLTNTYFDLDVWEALTAASSSTQNTGLAAAIVVEMVLNILLLVLAVLVIRLFFGRRSSAPRLIRIFYLANLGVQVLLVALMVAVGVADQADTMGEVSRELFRSLVAAAIWVPYFHYSDRVRRTFLYPLRPLRLQQQEEQPEKELA